MECVCCSTTFSEKDLVRCNHCGFQVCEECFEYGILQQQKDPHCLHCKSLMHIETILEACDTDWLHEAFLPHMASLLLEKEKALLPYTQQETMIVRKHRECQEKLRNLPTDKNLKKTYKEDEFMVQKQIKDATKTKLNNMKKELRETSITLNKNKDKKIKPSKQPQLYVAKCMAEGCKGYVNSEYFCETCNVRICDDCYVILQDDCKRHTCRKEDKDLVHILKSNCKQCPKCHLPIMKAGGCDQMFCIMCKTAFSWETGEIVTGVIHNPHYFEWLSSTDSTMDIDIENIACGEIPELYVIMRGCNRSRIIMETYRNIRHIQMVILPTLAEDRVKDNIDLRVSFLLDDIDEEEWKKRLLYRERKRLKNTALRQVMDLFVVVAGDMMRRLVYKTTDYKVIEKECSSLCSYRDHCLQRVCQLYGGSYCT